MSEHNKDGVSAGQKTETNWKQERGQGNRSNKGNLQCTIVLRTSIILPSFLPSFLVSLTLWLGYGVTRQQAGAPRPAARAPHTLPLHPPFHPRHHPPAPPAARPPPHCSPPPPPAADGPTTCERDMQRRARARRRQRGRAWQYAPAGLLERLDDLLDLPDLHVAVRAVVRLRHGCRAPKVLARALFGRLFRNLD